MTWFLTPAEAAPQPAAAPVRGQIPSWGQQATGAGRDLWWRRDSWGAARSYTSQLESEMIDALGGQKAVYPTSPDGIRQFLNPKTRGHYLAGRVAELRAEDKEGKLSGLPSSPEEFDAEVLRRRKGDFDANRAMLERGDSTSARVVGEIGATVLEPASIATLPLGGSIRNVGRFVLTEGALGAASDLPGVIREQSVAKDLGFTPSNPVTELAVSAGASAGFAGILAGGVRGVDYVRGRRQAEVAARPGDRAGMDWEEDVDAAEGALRAGQEAPAIPNYRPSIQLPADQDPAVQNIMRMIHRIEAPGGFDQVYGGSVLQPPRRITTMSINEVLEWQDASVAAGSKSSAAGGAQIIRETLRGLRDEMGLSGNELFDANMQRRMTVQLMKRRGLDDWRAGRITTDQFMDNMAQEWAALPRATGPNAGRSHYAGDGLNSAQISLDEARAYFNGEHFSNVGSTGGVGTAPISWPAGRSIPQFEEVATPGGMSVGVRYRVADMSELTRASGDLQPRDRSRSASDEQIALIARNLDPRRLMPSPEASSGAPVIGPDGMIESGNGRVAALNRAADEHPENFAAYVKAVEDAGFAIPEGVQRPVLVAERVTQLDADGRRRFVRESNTSSIGRMSATEQAGVDADYLTQNAFDAFRAGRPLNSADNTEFVRRVFQAMPQAERAALMTAEGRLNIDGLRRMRQALFARAFEAEDLLRMLAETEHPAVENLLRMLEDLAPDWAAFRAAVDAGFIRPEFDITDALMDAVRTIAKARVDNREGQSVIAALRDRLAQGDMFADRDGAMAEALIDVFYRGDRARNPDASAAILQRYIAEAELAGRADMGDLLGGDDALTPLAVLRQAVAAHDARAPMPARIAAEAQEGTAEPATDLRALDTVEMPDGAHSPAVARATDAGRRELAEAIGQTVPDEGGDAAQAIAAARAAVAEDPDLSIRLGEGDDAQTYALADLLDDMDQDETLMTRMTSCALKGVPA